MKIKTLLYTAIALFSISFIACDDNLNPIGITIQPDSDSIFIGVDTVTITARTVSLSDSVYARTIYGLLGEYNDPIFGLVKSDYLCEFYCPENMSFIGKDQSTIQIDSVKLNTVFYGYIGNLTTPMRLSVYRANKSLAPTFFTNINPKKYIDPHIMGQSLFSIKDLPLQSSTGYKQLATDMGNTLGQEFLDLWKADPKKFANSDSLRTFFKGLYITSDFGTGSVLNVANTAVDVYYKYKGRNILDTADSTRTAIFRLAVTPEVIQLNHVENKLPSSFFIDGDGTTKSYLKAPAGVCTELTIPLKEILDKTSTKGEGATINLAKFSIKGFTEEEANSAMTRPANLLFINKDSIANFFVNKKIPDSKTSFIISIDRTTNKTNTYDFGNLSTLINHYKKEANPPTELKFLLIPVDVLIDENTAVYTAIYNRMIPTSAILRTDAKNMRVPLVFSKYNKTK